MGRVCVWMLCVSVVGACSEDPMTPMVGMDTGTTVPPTDTGVGFDTGLPAPDSGPPVVVDTGPPVVPDTGPPVMPDTGPPVSGACTNATDTPILMSPTLDMQVGSCAGMCFGGADCTTTCVQNLGVTPACAACFGQVTMCTASMCALQCLGGGDSPGCSMCRDMMGCSAAFTACAGTPP